MQIQHLFTHISQTTPSSGHSQTTTKAKQVKQAQTCWRSSLYVKCEKCDEPSAHLVAATSAESSSTTTSIASTVSPTEPSTPSEAAAASVTTITSTASTVSAVYKTNKREDCQKTREAVSGLSLSIFGMLKCWMESFSIFSILCFQDEELLQVIKNSPPSKPPSPGLGAPHLLHSCRRAKFMLPQELKRDQVDI